jgi:CHAT domain-containing protein
LNTAELGLALKGQPRQPIDTQLLLSIEAPNTKDYPLLESVKIEAEGITNLFNQVKRLQAAKATKQEVFNALNNYSVLHFTGYANDNPIHSKQSQLLLAEEEKLSIGEINSRVLYNYSLISFSGETAITTNQTISTEYVGIVSELMKAGVNHVVTTQWKVNNGANALVMTEFYRRLKIGKSAAVALNEAIAWLKELTVADLRKWYEDLLRKSPLGGVRIQTPIAEELRKLNGMGNGEKIYNHPYYWATFKVYGNLD